jgi:hypothetical protein
LIPLFRTRNFDPDGVTVGSLPLEFCQRNILNYVVCHSVICLRVASGLSNKVELSGLHVLMDLKDGGQDSHSDIYLASAIFNYRDFILATFPLRFEL